MIAINEIFTIKEVLILAMERTIALQGVPTGRQNA
jgi:hypothetical protein